MDPEDEFDEEDEDEEALVFSCSSLMGESDVETMVEGDIGDEGDIDSESVVAEGIIGDVK